MRTKLVFQFVRLFYDENLNLFETIEKEVFLFTLIAFDAVDLKDGVSEIIDTNKVLKFCIQVKGSQLIK